jgi:hypothetical protein
VGEQPTLSGGQHTPQLSLLSCGAGQRVKTTQCVLSTHRKVGTREASQAPDPVAREILSLRPLSATRPQLARRRDLLSGGCSSVVIRCLRGPQKAAWPQATTVYPATTRVHSRLG